MNRWHAEDLHPFKRIRGRRALVMAAALLLAPVTGEAATRIYKTVDEDGNVVFTDVPPKDGEVGQTVDVGEGNTFTPPPAASAGQSLERWLGRAHDEQAPDEARPASYQSLRVASPPNEEPLRDNAGNVVVTAAVEPELNPAHTIQVYVDGELRTSGRATSFQLSNLDRGTHRVELRIVDGSGNTLVRSEPSVFHLQRRSVILQPANRRAD